MSFEYATPAERAIAKAVVETALKLECLVSVYDGEEWTISRSDDAEVILNALATTDADILHFYDQNRERIGWVQLIWGNDRDLISNSSDSPAMERLLENGMDVADNWQD